MVSCPILLMNLPALLEHFSDAQRLQIREYFVERSLFLDMRFPLDRPSLKDGLKTLESLLRELVIDKLVIET
jgi:hypothetical protein